MDGDGGGYRVRFLERPCARRCLTTSTSAQPTAAAAPACTYPTPPPSPITMRCSGRRLPAVSLRSRAAGKGGSDGGGQQPGAVAALEGDTGCGNIRAATEGSGRGSLGAHLMASGSYSARPSLRGASAGGSPWAARWAEVPLLCTGPDGSVRLCWRQVTPGRLWLANQAQHTSTTREAVRPVPQRADAWGRHACAPPAGHPVQRHADAAAADGYAAADCTQPVSKHRPGVHWLVAIEILRFGDK